EFKSRSGYHGKAKNNQSNKQCRETTLGWFFCFCPSPSSRFLLALFSFWLVSRNMLGDIQHEKKIRVRLRAKKYLKSGEGLSMKIE
ncbi:hypothetical protein, partial [Lelliottia nimipressuralis]|uniref:hypothetical protein n=1 Tax=Lelliottia nimipressuralis TaxID=69220 RepID=UPI0019D6BD93